MYVPAELNVKEQEPAATLAVQVGPLFPAETATLPVGETTVVKLVTLKVIVTGVPGKAGLGLTDAI